jgi:hypothetical protein
MGTASNSEEQAEPLPTAHRRNWLAVPLLSDAPIKMGLPPIPKNKPGRCSQRIAGIGWLSPFLLNAPIRMGDCLQFRRTGRAVAHSASPELAGCPLSIPCAPVKLVKIRRL